MLLALPKFNLASFSFLFVVSLFTLLMGYLLNNNILFTTKTKKITVASSVIIILIFILSFFKYSIFQKFSYQNLLNQEFSASKFIFIIGISYSSFKMMHFIIESYKQQIKKINVINFINYIFFFPAFISGPINRYNHFCEQIDIKNNNGLKNDIKAGIERIIHGLFKKFVLSSIVYPYAIINMQKSFFELGIYEIIIGLYAHTLYFYFDFAGYSDIAIGSAKIMGIGLPENFNNPFMKKNIQQLWANWHISLTSWLTDYIYWPLSKKLRNTQYFKKRPIALSNISIIITFVICGMWHGETLNFVIWGFYHGIGLAVLNIYQKRKRKIRNKTLRNYFLSPYSQVVGIIVTFNYFALGISFFSLNINELVMLFSNIF